MSPLLGGFSNISECIQICLALLKVFYFHLFFQNFQSSWTIGNKIVFNIWGRFSAFDFCHKVELITLGMHEIIYLDENL